MSPSFSKKFGLDMNPNKSVLVLFTRKLNMESLAGKRKGCGRKGMTWKGSIEKGKLKLVSRCAKIILVTHGGFALILHISPAIVLMSAHETKKCQSEYKKVSSFVSISSPLLLIC